MVSYYGDFAEDDTVNLPFNTFDSNDPANSVTATDLIAGDIFVHKDGSATAITTDGASIDIDAPGVGAHMITIDTSVHADYSTGSEYAVRVDGVTVDGGTVNAWIGAFSIERAGGALAVAKLIPTTAMRGTDSAALASVCTEVRLATLTDWINGGRLDLLLDAIPTTAMRGTDSAALASEVTAARMATLTDWINGGRLDLLLDAIKAITDQFAFTNANQVDANIQSINDAAVTGDGNAAPWDGA